MGVPARVTSSHRLPSILSFALIGTLVASATLVACGEKFTSCHERRRCPDPKSVGNGGEGGESAGSGTDGGWGGDAVSSGGTAGSGGRMGGIAGAEGTTGGTSTGGTGGQDDDPPSEGGSGGETVSPCDPSAKPPRLLAPLSTALVTSRRPTLEFEPSDDCGPVVVELCADRACSDIIGTATVDPDGFKARPAEDLPQGVVFWRARTGSKSSAVWQFTVGKGTNVDTWWSTIPDFNGDGKADVAVGTSSGVVYVYYGSEDGLVVESPTVLDVSDDSGLVFGDELASAGDVNGDGFADLLVSAPIAPDGGAGTKFYLFLGGADGIQRQPFKQFEHNYVRFREESVGSFRGGADINRDGYSDFVVAQSGDFTAFFGRAAGDLVTRREAFIPSGYLRFGSSIAFCDLDGDRRVDMVAGTPHPQIDPNPQENLFVLLRASGTSFERSKEVVGEPGHGWRVGCADFNGDGYPEVLSSHPTSNGRGAGYAGDVLLFSNAGGILNEVGASVPGQAEIGYAGSGVSMSVVGDMDGNGIPELAIGQGYNELIRVTFNAAGRSATDVVVLGEATDVQGSFGAAYRSRHQRRRAGGSCCGIPRFRAERKGHCFPRQPFVMDRRPVE